MKVTMKDIAEALDVSITTVSRALNNQRAYRRVYKKDGHRQSVRNGIRVT